MFRLLLSFSAAAFSLYVTSGCVIGQERPVTIEQVEVALRDAKSEHMRGVRGRYRLCLKSATAKELKITPPQRNALIKLAGAMSLKRVLDQNPDLELPDVNTEEEAKAALAPLMRQMDRAAQSADDGLQEVLLPSQYSKLLQIQVGHVGVSSIRDSIVARELDLSDDERKSLQAVESWRRSTESELAAADLLARVEFLENYETRVLDSLESSNRLKFRQWRSRRADIAASKNR